MSINPLAAKGYHFETECRHVQDVNLSLLAYLFIIGYIKNEVRDLVCDECLLYKHTRNGLEDPKTIILIYKIF